MSTPITLKRPPTETSNPKSLSDLIGAAWAMKGQLTYEDAEAVLTYWWQQHPFSYKIAKGQIPYLSAIDLHDVPSGSIALPTGVEVVRFQIAEGHEVFLGAMDGDNFNTKGWLIRIVHLGHNFRWQYVMSADDKSVEEHFDTINAESKEPTLRGLSQEQYALESKICKDSIRAIINVLMLNKCKPEFFKPDVLAKDRADHAEATANGDAARAKAIEDRAKRRKGPSYIFDTGENWDIDLGHIGPATPTNHGVGATRALCWIRRGHWRRVRYGAGRVFAKWHFFPPQVCRPEFAKLV